MCSSMRTSPLWFVLSVQGQPQENTVPNKNIRPLADEDCETFRQEVDLIHEERQRLNVEGRSEEAVQLERVFNPNRSPDAVRDIEYK